MTSQGNHQPALVWITQLTFSLFSVLVIFLCNMEEKPTKMLSPFLFGTVETFVDKVELQMYSISALHARGS